MDSNNESQPKKKNRGGRPSRAGTIRKEFRIYARLSAEESALLDAGSEELGITRSEAMRFALHLAQGLSPQEAIFKCQG